MSTGLIQQVIVAILDEKSEIPPHEVKIVCTASFKYWHALESVEDRFSLDLSQLDLSQKIWDNL